MSISLQDGRADKPNGEGRSPMIKRVVERWAAIEARFIAASSALDEWMDAESADGRAVYASQAPTWPDYSVAEADYLRAKAVLESLLVIGAEPIS